MKLTRAGEYAVRCVLHLASQGKGVVVSRRIIADTFDIPEKFLAKIAQQLARAGLIEIRQGARGGYLLTRNPAEITLLEVIEAIIGEISLNECVSSSEVCRASANCAINRVWVKACTQLRETLREVDFAALLKEDSCFIFPTVSFLDNHNSPGR